MSTPNDLITHAEARTLLGVSVKKMAQIAKKLKAYQNPLDMRRKYYSRAEVEAVKTNWQEKVAA